jgi:hypothetical protein
MVSLVIYLKVLVLQQFILWQYHSNFGNICSCQFFPLLHMNAQRNLKHSPKGAIWDSCKTIQCPLFCITIHTSFTTCINTSQVNCMNFHLHDF